MQNIEPMQFVSGLLYEYYFICKRKTWYVANGISMEENNENVQIGRLIDENSYNRERKHILIDEKASIDFLKDNTVYEIKKSTSEKQAALEQIKYYLFILHEKGIVDVRGELRVPKENYIESIVLSKDDIQQIKQNVSLIFRLISGTIPQPLIYSRICSKCAFFELCFI
jgi:CRISPR-associated exonuclease Cas4